MAQQKRVWQIPTILRELRRVILEATDGELDIMDTDRDMSVDYMVDLLKDHHMQVEMELPGQTSIPMPEEE